MRFARLSSAAVTALAAIVLIGAAPASAQEEIVLCTVNAETCKAGQLAGDEFTAESKATLDFGELGSIQCSSAISQSETGLISALSFGECSEGCTVKADGLPYGDEYSAAGEGNATLQIHDAGNGPPTLAVECGAAKCVFSSSAIEATLEGGQPPVVSMSNVLAEEEESFFCPKTVQWDASYAFVPKWLDLYASYYLPEGPTFCEVNAATCPAKSVAVISHNELAGSMTFGKLIGGGTVSCADGGFLLLQEEAGLWRFKPWAFAECSSATYTECGIKFKGQYSTELGPDGEGNGVALVFEHLMAKQGPPTLLVNCAYLETPFSCAYSTAEFSLEFNGGEAATVGQAVALKRTEGSPTFCPAITTLNATYEASNLLGEPGSSLYMTES